MNVEHIVKMTIDELKRNNMLRVSKTNVFQKTEKILYIYPDMTKVNDSFIQEVEKSLANLKNDPDYRIVELKYFDKRTHEEIAEIIGVDPKTVTRRKNRIIKRLSFMLFPCEAINELLNE